MTTASTRYERTSDRSSSGWMCWRKYSSAAQRSRRTCRWPEHWNRRKNGWWPASSHQRRDCRGLVKRWQAVLEGQVRRLDARSWRLLFRRGTGEDKAVAATRPQQVHAICQNQFAFGYADFVTRPADGISQPIRGININGAVQPAQLQRRDVNVFVVAGQQRVMGDRILNFFCREHATRHHREGKDRTRRASCRRRHGILDPVPEYLRERIVGELNRRHAVSGGFHCRAHQQCHDGGEQK